MSLPRNWQRQLMSWLLSSLVGFGSLWPLLDLLALGPEAPAALVYILVFTLAVRLTEGIKAGIRPLVRLGLLAAFVLANGGVQKGAQLFSAMVNLAPLPSALLLYSDFLVPLLALVMALFGLLLTAGDAALAVPLILTVSVMTWMSGSRQNLSHYLPMALSIPLLFAFNRPLNALLTERQEVGSPRRFIRRALPLALVILLAASLLTPQYRTTYAPMEQKADELRQLINDYFFFTDSRQSFSLRSEGWQPMGDEGLGGVPQVPDTPVMEVRGDGRLYLRGAIRDMYNGRAWYDTISSQRYSYNSIRYLSLRDTLLDMNLPPEGNTASKQAAVHMLRASTSTLFLPQRARDMVLGVRMVPYFNLSTELFITRNLEAGDGYSVSYEDYVAGSEAAQLAKRLESRDDPRYANMQQQYTQLPAHLTPDGIIADLARSMAGNAGTPYEMADKIMRTLKQNYSYTLNVPPTPTDIDFTAHFLFESKAGYCTYFATAMVVLARSLNLPARYVEGFLAEGEGTDSPVTLTSRNGHAWAEVYIPSVGWVVFDATAPSPDESGGDSGGDQQPEPSPSPEVQPTPSPEPEEAPEPTPSPTPQNLPTTSPAPTQVPPNADNLPDPDKPPFPWWILLVLAAIALFVWRVRATDPRLCAAKAKDSTTQLIIWWQAFCRAQAVRGQGMAAHETMQGYARRVGGDSQDLRALAGAVSAARYGRRQATPEAAQRMQITYNDLYIKLSLWQKIRLFLSRLMPRRSLAQVLKSLPGQIHQWLRRVYAKRRSTHAAAEQPKAKAKREKK